jgi:anti-sigma B factor antagonist
MSFQVSHNGGVTLVEVEGQLIVGNRQELKQKVLEHGGELRLSSLNEDLRTLFELTKLDTLFKIADTKEEALDGF